MKSRIENLKSLIHNGIYVAPYNLIGLTLTINNKRVDLGEKTEQMALAFCRKMKKDAEIVHLRDDIFLWNFFTDFLKALEEENPSLKFPIKKFFVEPINTTAYKLTFDPEEITFDFADIYSYLDEEAKKKEQMSKEEKKRLSQERKEKREKLKEKYGFAIVDGNKVEIANWAAEPSCLFLGRGVHPLRGRWKEGPKEKDIILNLSPDAPRVDENWKDIVWEPDKLYLAKWTDKLSGKVKYVWFSPSVPLMQQREIKKFEKARELTKYIDSVYNHICNNLDSSDVKRKKVATVCWLIYTLNMRVGDEKDPDEADTVGAITLRPEHVGVGEREIAFHFLGKDSVLWNKRIEAPEKVRDNLKYFILNCKEYLFEGITSKDVSKFLSEKMPGLTAKVFRTWKCTITIENYLKAAKCSPEDPEYYKLFIAKKANLEGAIVCNHKKKVPDNVEEKLIKKSLKVMELENKYRSEKNVKKSEKLKDKMTKALLDYQLASESKEYNLNTSRNNYIDPRVYWEWMKKIGLSPEKFYSKAQLKRFSWAFK